MESSLVFFHGCRIIGLTLENMNLQKWAPSDFSKKSLIIVHKAAFVSLKSCNSVEDVWVHPCSEMSWVRQEELTRSRLDNVDDVSINYTAYQWS